MEKRRKTTIDEVITPCEGCGFLISQRHHILEFSEHGESNMQIYLCPNCHYMLHLCIKTKIYQRKRAIILWDYFESIMGKDNKIIQFYLQKTKEYQEMKFEHFISNTEI